MLHSSLHAKTLENPATSQTTEQRARAGNDVVSPSSTAAPAVGGDESDAVAPSLIEITRHSNDDASLASTRDGGDLRRDNVDISTTNDGRALRRVSTDDTQSATAPVDAGARSLMLRIRSAIDDGAQSDRSIEIALGRLRNQSRASNEELELLRARLQDLLNPAAQENKLTVVQQASPRTEYTLSGAVYLVDRSGVEYWEMFFALRPTGASWRIWKNAAPIRMERIRQMADSDSLEFNGTNP